MKVASFITPPLFCFMACPMDPRWISYGFCISNPLLQGNENSLSFAKSCVAHSIDLIGYYFFTGWVYEELFCVSIEFWHKIWGAISVMMEGVCRVGRFFGWTMRFWAVSPVARGSLGRFHTTLSCTPLFHDALWLNMGIPGVIWGTIEVIIAKRNQQFFLIPAGCVVQEGGLFLPWPDDRQPRAHTFQSEFNKPARHQNFVRYW